MEFQIQTNPPNANQIPTKEDLFGVTALMLQVFYKKKEFFRVSGLSSLSSFQIGYFVYNDYMNPDLLEQNPQVPVIEEIYRSINVSQPRITRYVIDWEG